MKIKNTFMRGTLFVAVILFTLQIFLAIGEAKQNDPYALMYDSNQRLSEKIECMPYFETDEQDGLISEEGNVLSDKGEQGELFEAEQENLLNSDADASIEQDEKEKIKKDILTLAQEGKIEDIDILDELSKEVKDQIKQMEENLKEDRYIVKYRDNNSICVSDLILDNSKGIEIKASDRCGEMEVLILEEKVNPAEFASALEEAGASSEIEYIQPDFLVYYSAEEESESLDYENDDWTEEPGSEFEDPFVEPEPEDNTPSEEAPVEETPVEETPVEETPVEETPVEEAPVEMIDDEIIVAVIDTGVDNTHPGLVDYLWDNTGEIADDGIDNDGNGYVDDNSGWNFYDDDNQVYDDNCPLQSAHGTHISGIVVERVADYNVQVMPLKVFGENGAYTSDIIDAINYAEANGARIANCSFGSTDDNPALRDAMEASGMLFVCAVGNARSDLEETPIYPACFGLDNLISVTSTNSDGGLSYFSNYSNSLVDLAACGRDVESTLPEGEYGCQSGTSMSAGQVSGVAAAVLSMESDLDAFDLKARLIYTADMLSNLQETVVNGRQLNQKNALQGEEQTKILKNDPEEDFDVNGYTPTADELYELYSNSGDVIQAEAGSSFSLVLKENGTVWAGGANAYGQCGSGQFSYAESLVQVIGLTNVVQISAGESYGLALKSDGTIWAWGYNEYGQLGDGTTTGTGTPVQVSGLSGAYQVSAGKYHSLAVKTDGTVWAWGYNSTGQLGNGTTTNSSTPVQVSGLSGVYQVSAGGYHSLAVKTDGTVRAWGYNSKGQLGNGTTTSSSTPVQVNMLNDISQVSAGGYHSLAVNSTGMAWGWGYNRYGQVGDDSTVTRTSPRMIDMSQPSDISQVDAGNYHSLAVKTDGTVWYWGDDDGDEAGAESPAQISGITTAIQVVAGYEHSLAVKFDGTVSAWGNNPYGELMDGTIVCSSTPIQIVGSTGMAQAFAGFKHSLVVDSEGTVWACGDNAHGQLGDGTTTNRSTPVQVSGLSDVSQVATGQYHSLALKIDGTIWAWGENEDGQLGDGSTTDKRTPVQVSSFNDVVQVAAGGTYSLALKSDGTVWKWGSGTETPVQVSGLTGVVQVAVGENHRLALKSDGTVWAWGNNEYGQLGDGTTTNRSTPVEVSSLSGVVQISAGGNHSLALKSDGTAWAWGYNNYGQLGDGTTTNRSTPVEVSSLSVVVQISAGRNHSLALKSDGTAWAWGYNGYGRLGDGTTTQRNTPVQVSGLSGADQVSAGGYHSLAVKSDGTVFSWGYNSDGQLGDGTTTERSTPVQFIGFCDVEQVAAGSRHSIALAAGGSVWAWGNNYSGQLGDNTTICRSTPMPVSGLSGVVQVAAGANHNLAVRSDGTIWAWGRNSYGQLGDGTTTNAKIPVQVYGLSGMLQAAAGDNHSLALASGGTVYAWGNNTYGQLGNGTTTNKTRRVLVSGLSGVAQVAAGGNHSLAVKSDGTVWAWGDNSSGQLGDGTTTNRSTSVQVSGLTNVAQVAAGDDHSLALKSDGTVWAWGDNGSGQLGDGTTTNRTTPVQVSGLSNVVQISAGNDYSIALKSDGTIWAWGNNANCQLGDGTNINRNTPAQTDTRDDVTQVAAGAEHCLALTLDSSIWGWGMNDYGQLGSSPLESSGTPIQSETNHNVIPNLSTPRKELAVIESSGKLYAIGGYASDYSDAVEVYEAASDAWTTITSMTTAREGLGAAATAGNIYAIGGFDGSNYLTTVEQYNINADTWTTKTSMPTARTGLGVISVNGSIYAIGGYDGTDYLTSVEEYDPYGDTWTTKQSMSTARSDFGVVEINGILYVLGGRNSSGALSTVEAYDPITNEWATLDSMSIPRYDLGAAALNGQVVVMGGFSGSNYINKVEVYDPSAAAWSLNSGLLDSRANFGAATLGESIYLVGGENAGGYLSTSEAYDLGNIVWDQEAEMPSGRSELGAATVDGIVYAIGGYLSGYKNTVEAYDPSTDTWTAKASMSSARAGLGVIAVNGKIYAIGGYDGTNYSNTVEEYDPSTNTWTTKTAMPTARSHFGIAVANGKIYAIGGYDGTNYLNIVEEYDPSTDTWTTKTAMSTARSEVGAAAVNGKIYVVGGFDGTNSLATVEAYNSITNAWSTMESMPTARRNLGVVALNGKIYAMGGGIGTALYNVVEDYDPSTDTWTAKAALPNFNFSFGTCVDNSNIYVIGGSPYLNCSTLLSGNIDDYILSENSLATLVHLGEDEINPSGNLSRTYLGYSIATTGFSIDLCWTYNSRDDRTDGPLGRGWTFGFEGSIADYGTNQKIVRLPDGSAMTFTQDGTEYIADNSRATLEKHTRGLGGFAEITYILTTPDQYTYGFSGEDGKMEWMKDRNGNTIEITDHYFSLPPFPEVLINTKITYLTDKEVTVEYDNEKISTITDPEGRTLEFGYTYGRLTSVTYPNGNAIYYSYDSEGYLSEVRDNDNNLIEAFAYDDSVGDDTVRLAAVSNAYGNYTTYMYDIAYNKVTATDLNDRLTATWFDSNLYPVIEQDADGRRSVTLYNLDAEGNNNYGEITSYKDRNGNRTEYERDSNGNITKIYNPDSSYTEYGYDSKNNKIWEKDETGKYTFYIYDANMINLVKIAQPLNGTDQYSENNETAFAVTNYVYYTDAEASSLGYKAKGLLKTETDPEGNITSYTYDAYGNIATVTNPESKVTTYSYNAIGWRTNETTPKGYTTTYVYDDNGNIEKITASGNEIPAGGYVTRRTYDDMNRMIMDVSPNLYDAAQDDLANHAYNGTSGYSYTYYSSGLKHTVTDPCGNVTTYTYDYYGNILSLTEPNGSIYLYTYDVINRISTVSFKSDVNATAVLLMSYSYLILANGNTQATETEYLEDTETAVTTYTYNYRGNQIRQDNPDGTHTTTNYNTNGTVFSTLDGRGNCTYYWYDGLNRQTEQWAAYQSGLYTYSSNVYNKAGLVTQRISCTEAVTLYEVPTSDLVTTSYTYYGDGNVHTVSDSAGREATYTYDDDGNISTHTVKVDALTNRTTTYTKNYFNKPITESISVRKGDLSEFDFTNDDVITVTTSYTYDKEGNVLTITQPISTTENVVTTCTYDNMGRQTGVSQPGTDENQQAVTLSTTTTYNWNGDKLTFTDGNGNQTSYTYNSRAQLTTITDAEGGVTAYYYDRAGRKIAEVSPKNYDSEKTLEQMNRTIYTYDGMNRLKTISYSYVDPFSGLWTTYVSKAYQYDGNGNVIKELDALGYASGTGSTVDDKIDSGYGTIYTYDRANNTTAVLDPVSQDRSLTFTEQYAYDALGRTTAVTDARGYVTAYTYDDAGSVLTVSVDSQTIESNTYDLLGNCTSQTDGNGNTTTYTYNALDMLQTAVSPGDATIPSNTVQYQYDQHGNLTRSLDTAGTIDLYIYNQQSYLTSYTQTKLNDASEQIVVSQTRYDKAGNARFVTDANGVTTEYVYDDVNRMTDSIVTVTDCNNNTTQQTTSYAYDADGNVTTETDWLGNTVRYVYDPLDRLIEQIDALDVTIETLEYDNNNCQIKSYDALDNLTQYTYDKNNRLLTTVDPCNNVSSQSYDNAGNVATKTDGEGNVTTFGYDARNRMVSVINELSETTSYTYDGNNNLLTQTDGASHVVTYEFNVRNLLIRKIDHGGRTGTPGNYTYVAAKTESYTYTANGNLATMVDRNGVTTYFLYDSHSRLTSTTAGMNTVSYTYDGNGNPLTMTDSTGTTTWTYDERNRAKTKTVPDIGTSTFQYDVTTGLSTGYVKEITIDPKNNTTGKVTDPAGRLYQVIDGADTVTYTYYDNGSQASVTYPGGAREEYSYYDNNQLYALVNRKADNSVVETYTYTYDAAGNLLTKVDGKGTTTYTYDDLNRLLTVEEPGGKETAYTYDTAGNRATETVTDGSDTTVTTYTYNEQNRLLNTSAVLNQDPAVVVVYVYDNNGNLLNKGPDGGSPIAVYSYDGWNQMVSATEGATTVTMAYNGLGLRVEKTTGGATSRYLYEYSDVILETDGSNNQTGRNVYGANLVKRVAGGQSLFFFYNGHGDVTALISASSGDVVAGYYYDAFGNVVEKSGVVDNPYLYAGYRYDEELSLYYLLARFYDATIARFMQEDTYGGRISDPLSLNRYTYCLNNPLIYWDPTGHIVTPWDVVHGDSQAIAQIEEATNEYNEAAAAGDTEGMAVAHEKAVEARERFLDEASGEYVASDGTVYNRYGTDGNTSSVKALASYNGTLKINRIDLLKNWYVTNVYVKTTKIGAKMVDGVVYADAKQLAAELGYTISPPNPDGTITISSGSYSYTTQPGDSYVPLREVVTGGGYGDTISWWRDEDGFNVLVQPDLKNKAVQVTRAGDNITIKAYLNFEGAANEIFPGTNYTYAEAIYKGIEENWNNLSFVGTSYDFGIGKIITVKTELYSYYDSPSGVMMAPSTYNADQEYLTIRVDNRAPISFFGKSLEKRVCHVSRSGDWSISNLGTITMYPHYIAKDQSIDSMKVYTYGEYKQVAAHEFGHILGLDDAYDNQNTGGTRPAAEVTIEVPEIGMWLGDMMRNDGKVSANDIEMVWEAWSTNSWQYFQNYDGHTMSSVIRIIRIK